MDQFQQVQKPVQPGYQEPMNIPNYPNPMPVQPVYQEPMNIPNYANPMPVQPVIQQPIVTPVINQVVPAQGMDSIIVANTLKSNSVMIMCPYCKKSGMTRAERFCSCANICCCLCTSWYWIPGFWWVVFQVLRKKDISCYNANHYCCFCNQLIHQYRAC